MILNEQILKNKNRRYFHGTPFDDLDKSKNNYGCLFLTTDFSYAVSYSKVEEQGDFGYVFEFHLKKPMNIFNIRSTMDRFKLQRSVNDEIYSLANTNNWLTAHNGIQLRPKLLKSLKELGYDGFFDKEIDENEIYDNPAIGIFNTDKITLVDKISYKDFSKNKQFNNRHKDELNNLYNKLLLVFQAGIKDKNLLIDLLYLDYTKCLSRQEISDFIDKINFQKLQESKKIVYFNKINEPYYLIGNKLKEMVFKPETFLRIKEYLRSF